MRDADQAGRLQRGHTTAPAAPDVSVQRRHVANVSRWRWSQQGGAPIAPPVDQRGPPRIAGPGPDSGPKPRGPTGWPR